MNYIKDRLFIALKQSLFRLVIVAIVLLFAGIGYALHFPNSLYMGVTSILLAVIIIHKIRKSSTEADFNILVSLAWYSLFWTVRDLIMGFYTPASIFDNAVSLLPAVYFTLQRALGTNSFLVLSVLILHIGLSQVMQDTDNELLALLVMIIIARSRDGELKPIFYGLLWYQTYIATTKYTISSYPNKDVLYIIALGPYMVGLLYYYWGVLKNAE